MLPRFPVAVSIVATLSLAGILHGERLKDAAQDPLSKLSGQELVQRLADESVRARAFYELLRRNSPGSTESFEEFEDGHYEPQLISCPQGNGDPPIYIVLAGFLPRSTATVDQGY